MHIKKTMKAYLNKRTCFKACRNLGARLMLKEKMILSFAAASTGIVVLTGALHYYMTSSRILEEAEATTVQMVGNACQDINELFLQTFQVCSAMNDNISMQKLIRRQFSSIKEMYSHDLEGSMEMMVLPSYNRDIFGVYVLGDNGGAIRAIHHPFWCRIPGTRTGTESSTPRDRPNGFRPMRIPMWSAPLYLLCIHGNSFY